MPKFETLRLLRVDARKQPEETLEVTTANGALKRAQ